MNKNSNVSQKLAILRERRSIRSFASEEVPKSVLLELIEYATLAPSACNEQAWRFVIVNDPSLKQKIVDAGGSILINKSPCGILVVYRNTTRNTHYHDIFQTAGACIQNLLLAAQAHGLGACCLCTLPSMSFLRKLFDIPSDYSPMAYIILGYPSSKVIKDVPRKNKIEEIVSENRFPRQGLGPTQSRIKVYVGRLLIWIYRKLPTILKKNYINKIVDKKFTMKFEN